MPVDKVHAEQPGSDLCKNGAKATQNTIPQNVKARSNTILIPAAVERNSKDVRLSPKPCRIPALILNPRVPIIPTKITII